MHQITALPAFNDNYIWCIHAAGKALVVDPGDADIVQHYLQANNLQLVAILITHHHWDHVDGLPQLQQQWPQVPLYLPAAEQHKIKHIADHSHYLNADDQLEIPELALKFRIISTPGHTLGHICYVAEHAEQSWLFCGDTLFAGGCGRLFEGTPAQMSHSLARLAALPDATAVYCAHEYTLANLRFAIEVEPGNAQLQQRLVREQAKRRRDEPTVPSTIALEKATNPFLRYREAGIMARLIEAGKLPAVPADAVDSFRALREWKNVYR